MYQPLPHEDPFPLILTGYQLSLFTNHSTYSFIPVNSSILVNPSILVEPLILVNLLILFPNSRSKVPSIEPETVSFDAHQC